MLLTNKPTNQDLNLMDKVFSEAKKETEQGKAGVGAMLILGAEVIFSGHTSYKQTRDCTSHLEMCIIRTTAKKIYQLSESEKSKLCMYITLEPCLLCMYAMSFIGIKRVVYSALCEDVSANDWIEKDFTFRDLNTNHIRSEMEIVQGVKREIGLALLKDAKRQTLTSMAAAHSGEKL